MKRIRVSAISYLNSAPFAYGLRHCEIARHIDLSLDTPAVCAARLAEKDADIGLVPVAIIPNLPYYQIISDFCIGAGGNVRTVVLCANSPIEMVKQVYMDNESRTSALLSRILMRNYWKVSPQIEQIKDKDDIDYLKTDTAYVLIGDKVFEHANKFAYIYDLAATWQQYRGLPFVFATWTAVTALSSDFISLFNSALSFGLDNIPKTIAESEFLPTDEQTAITYLTKNIDYKFDNEKKKALVEFWNLALEEIKSKFRS